MTCHTHCHNSKRRPYFPHLISSHGYHVVIINCTKLKYNAFEWPSMEWWHTKFRDNQLVKEPKWGTHARTHTKHGDLTSLLTFLFRKERGQKLQTWLRCQISNLYLSSDWLRWSSGSVLALGTQVRGFEPGRNRRIFKGEKNPQHAFLRRGSKAVGPMS